MKRRWVRVGLQVVDPVLRIYFAYSGRKFVLLHAFQKKSQKTTAKELETAEARMKDYVERDSEYRKRRQR